MELSSIGDSRKYSTVYPIRDSVVSGEASPAWWILTDAPRIGPNSRDSGAVLCAEDPVYPVCEAGHHLGILSSRSSSGNRCIQGPADGSH